MSLVLDRPPVSFNYTSMAKLQQIRGGHYALSGELNFDTVPPLLQQSATLFTQHSTVAIDLSGVSRSNSAGLGLLLEWVRWGRAANAQLEFTGLPQQLLNIARATDLESVLPIAATT